MGQYLLDLVPKFYNGMFNLFLADDIIKDDKAVLVKELFDLFRPIIIDIK